MPANAQSLGTLTWQLQPFCNRVSVTVVQSGGVYTMDGFDDQCRVGPRAPVVGVATPNPDGTIAFGWTIVTPGGKPVHVDARIDLGSLGGSWSDSAGNSGALAFGADVAGMARPVPAVAPGTVTTTAIADGAVTSAQIANGTIGSADVDATIQRTLSGSCGVGRFVQTVDTLAQVRCWDGTTGGNASAALGDGALAANTGTSNTGLGDSALAATTSGGSNTAVGASALQANVLGSSNTTVGALALMTSTATGNTAVGAQALRTVASGAANTAIGDSALRLATFSFNTAVGTRAAELTTNGFGTVAVGYHALRANGIGFGNVAVGRGALESVAGPSDQNIAIGNLAGSNLLSGSSNIYVGHRGVAGESARIRLGEFQTSASIAGVYGVNIGAGASAVLIAGDGQLGTISSSRRYKFDITDMGDFSARLARLRPVTFRYTRPAADGSTPLDFGLIAEEVADVFPELALRGADGRIETVAYHKLPPLLLNELQAQQRTISTQAHELAILRRAVEELRSDIARLVR